MYPRLSWTTLQAWEDCPQRLLLHRQRKRKPISQRYVLVGSVLHYVSEQLLLRANDISDIVQQADRDFMRRVQEADVLGWDADELDENRERVTTGAWRLAELYDEEFGGTDRAALIPELHLFQFYPGWALEGYMDIAVMESHRAYAERVYDVKTGTSHQAGQLEFYSVLCEARFGVRPEYLAWIEPLARGVVEVPVTDQAHEEMKLRVVAAVKGIRAGDFVTSGFPKKCSRCPSETMCPATDWARAGRLG